MNLQKRDCPIGVALYPLGDETLEIQLKIDTDAYRLFASSVKCDQISQLMGIVYQLYSEGSDNHKTYFSFRGRHYQFDGPEVTVASKGAWLYENDKYVVELSRLLHGEESKDQNQDIVSLKICTPDAEKTYSVDGRDLSYAISKAVTETIKKYGFYGYSMSTGSRICNGDTIDINQLLFLKAYALGVMNVRELTTVRIEKGSWQYHEISSFEQELELLLFDM